MKYSTINQLFISSLAALLFSVCTVPVAHAFSMDEMVDGYTSSNVSANSRSSKNSRRGFASGGSARIRFENKPMPDLYNVNLPSFSADCNGLDMNAGSLSWISASEFMDAARQLASPGVVIYALSLALNQMCTPCAQEMAKLQDMLNGFQNMLKMSCEEVGTALFEKSGAKEAAAGINHALMETARSFGGSGDDAELEPGNAVMSNGGSDLDEIVNGNVVWKHLGRVENIGGWIEETAGTYKAKQLIMSMVGTTAIAGATHGGSQEDLDIQSLEPRPPHLKTFVYGGEVRGITCDTAEKCLRPKYGVIDDAVALKDTFFGYLDPTDVNSIAFKFGIHENGITITDAEASFLEKAGTHVDIVPSMRKMAMSGRRIKTSTATFLSEWIAIEIALEFMLDYVDTSQSAMSNLDDKSSIPERNIYQMRAMYRNEAKSMRQELVQKNEASADIARIIDSVIGKSK